jgi:hypothetical protein
MEDYMVDELCDVESSNLKKIAKKDGDLMVEFRNGAVYRYPGLSHEFENLKTAKSVGSYFARNIRNETNIKVDLTFW